MKITYFFNDGTKSVVEVDDATGEMIMEDRRREERERKFAQRHTYSIDALVYEGLDYADRTPVLTEEEIAENEALEAARIAEIKEIYASLTETQKRRLRLYRDLGTYRAVAEAEGVDVHTVYECLQAVFKKFKKFL